MECCICKRLIKGFGNNPWPLKYKNEERCCDMCNIEVVIPLRLKNMEKKKEE